MIKPAPKKLLGSRDVACLKKYATKKKHAVELGTYFGGGAWVLSEIAAKVSTFDIFEDIDKIECGTKSHYKDLFKDEPHYYKDVKNILAQKHNIDVYKKNTSESANLFDDKSIDFLFIDADHSYKGVKNDFESWFPKIENGGHILLHDSTHNEWSVNKYMVAELLTRQDIKRIDTIGSITVFLKK